MKKVLMINNLTSSFIKDDYEILRNIYKVDLIEPEPISNKLLYLKYLIFNLYPTIKKAKNYDYIYSWWCTSFFSALVSLFSNTKLILVAGGFDVVKDKELKYGVFSNKLYSIITFFNMMIAHKILCVSETTKDNIKKINKSFSKKCTVILPSVRKKFWKNYNRNGRDYYTTTCINNYKDYSKALIRHKVKGVDLFVKEVRNNPNQKYILIGYDKNTFLKLEKNIPENLIIYPRVNQEVLRGLYNMTKYYIQYSRHESYGCSIAEAYLCGANILIGKNINIDLENIYDRTKRATEISKLLNESN